ncbi:HMA2 domain-containing protein [Scytonema sp. NUACC26]|uniref:HMA2 domain-containing protein n=1 Tax=Scytonema sp. NUACC26 TaxID=3140176 RepID=UPI0034DB8885
MTSRKRDDSNKNIIPERSRPANKTASSIANKTVLSERISYSVAHAIPGRIRFRIPRLSKDSTYAEKLKQVMEFDSRVTKVRVNPAAASIVIDYSIEIIKDEQMRSHLIHLIQTAPDIVIPTGVTAKSIVGTIFDAVIHLIDTTRNINQAHNAIKYQRFRNDTWERVLSTTRNIMKRLKSATMFILPNKRWQKRHKLDEVGLQPLKLQAVGEGDL